MGDGLAQEKYMKALRLGFPWQGSGLLLGLLLGSFLPALSAGQDLASQLYALKPSVSDPQRRIASSVRAARQIVAQYGAAAARTQMQRMLRVESAETVAVYIHISTFTPETLATLQQYVVQVLQSDAQLGVVYAIVAFGALENIAALPFVDRIGPPVYGVRRTGSVTSEGDTAMLADLARANLG